MNPARLQAHEALKARRARMGCYVVPEPPRPAPDPFLQRPRRLKVDQVVARVASHYGVQPSLLVGSGARGRPVGASAELRIPRLVVVYLARRLTLSSTAGLVERLGLKEDQSLARQLRRCRDLMGVSREFADEVAALEWELSNA